VKVNWQAANIGVLVTCFMLVGFLFGFGFQINTEQKYLPEEISEAQAVVCPVITNKTAPQRVPACHSHWSELGCIFLLAMGLSDHLS
jgi:hypothetical protein